MTITSYSELKTAIVNWYKDRSDLTTFADEIIDLAEGFLNGEMRTREMLTTDDLTPSSNVCTLPADYLDYVRVVELASIRRPLEFITPNAADRLYPTRESGLADHFMIVGNSLTALPLSANDIELTYYQKIPALSGSATSNWLLVRSPNLYLHTCLMYAAQLVSERGAQEIEAGIVRALIDQMQALSDRSQYGMAGMTLTEFTP